MNLSEKIAKAKEYIDIIQTSQNNVQKSSIYLQRIWNLLDDDEVKVVLGQLSFGLLPVLVNIVQSEEAILKGNALGCLWFLSRSNENKEILAEPELGLVPYLVRNLPLQNIIGEYSFNVLINCSLQPETHSYLLSADVGYLEFCVNKIRNTRETDPFVALANITSCIYQANLHQLVLLRVHELIFQKLFYFGVDISQWTGRSGGMVYWCLNFLVDFTRFPEGVKYFDNQFPFLSSSEFFLHLLACTEIESLKTLCIICHCSLIWEFYESWLPKICITYPHLPNLLLGSIRATLDQDQGDYARMMENLGYVFGILSMKVMTNVLKILCQSSKENFEIFINHKLFFANCFDLIKLYLEDSKELSARFDCVETAGGGGNDEETLINVLEILFIYKNFPEKDKSIFRISKLFSSSSITTKKIQTYAENILKLSASTGARKVPEKALVLCQLILAK